MSRFISAGTDDTTADRDTAWLQAQQTLEANKVAAAAAAAGGNEPKSLYETLQANKAAKQESHEASLKLSNQFQTLDEDEITFLDSVLESTRAKDAAIKAETQQRLEDFRRRREEAEKSGGVVGEGEGGGEGVRWEAAGRRKRRRREEGVVGGVKVRRMSSTGEGRVGGKSEGSAVGKAGERDEDGEGKDEVKIAVSEQASAIEKGEKASPLPPPAEPPTKSPSHPATALGLAAYSSSEEDD